MTTVSALLVAAGALVAIVVLLRRHAESRHDRAPSDPRAADRVFVRSIALLGVPTALALNGLIQLASLALVKLPHTLDVARLWALAAAAGLVVVLVLMGAALALLGRSHRTFRVLVEIATIGAIGATSTAFVELRRWNIAADDAPAARIDAVAKSVGEPAWRGKALRGVELMVVDTAQAGGWENVRFRVSTVTAATLRFDDRVVVEQHPGALGVRWIGAVRRSDDP